MKSLIDPCRGNHDGDNDGADDSPDPNEKERDALRARIATLEAEVAALREGISEALPVLAQCAIHGGYVLMDERGGNAAIADVSAKWPPCAICESAGDHYEHAKAICEKLDALRAAKETK